MKTTSHPARFLGILASLGLSCLPAWVGPACAADYEWNFASGNLNPALGNGVLDYADTASQTLTSFGTADGTSVPTIGGQPAPYLFVPGFSDAANGLNLTLTDTGPNGGGGYVNQYTFVFDILSPGSLNWTPFFNTDYNNGNDADFYIGPDGSVGIGALGYSAIGLIRPDTWYRVAFAADLGSGTVKYYIDGAVVHQSSGGVADGRFSLYSNADPGPDVRLFNEGDSGGVYTHDVYLSSLFFTDRTLSDAELLALGRPSALGVMVPEPSTWTLVGLGLAWLVAMGRRRLS